MFDLLAVTKIDRLFRNQRLLQNYIYELDLMGVQFLSLSEGAILVNLVETGSLF